MKKYFLFQGDFMLSTMLQFILINVYCKIEKIKILPKNPAKNPAKLFQSCQKILLK